MEENRELDTLVGEIEEQQKRTTEYKHYNYI